MQAHRHRSSGFPLARVLAIVIALHVVLGGGALWLAKTQSGQDFARVYKIKLFEPPKPEQAKKEPPPPPPPPPDKPSPPPPAPSEAPKLASARSPSAAPAPSVSIEGGGGGPNWSGGRFQSGLGEGPMAGFHGAVAGRLRQCNPPPVVDVRPVEIEFIFAANGTVKSFRLARPSGNPSTDDGVLKAAACVQSSGAFTLPEAKPLVVTVKMTPY